MAEDLESVVGEVFELSGGCWETEDSDVVHDGEGLCRCERLDWGGVGGVDEAVVRDVGMISKVFERGVEEAGVE